jgi:hypothetical protein
MSLPLEETDAVKMFRRVSLSGGRWCKLGVIPGWTMSTVSCGETWRERTLLPCYEEEE